MDVSRRHFLRFSLGTGGGMALAGLAGSGVNLGPLVAQAQDLRIKNAKVTPTYPLEMPKGANNGAKMTGLEMTPVERCAGSTAGPASAWTVIYPLSQRCAERELIAM